MFFGGIFFTAKNFNDLGCTLITFSVIFFVLFSLFGIFSYNDHVNNLACIKMQDETITVHQQRLASLNKQYEAITKNIHSASLMNADSPVKSVIEGITGAENSITNAKLKVIEARIDIEARKRGIYSLLAILF